MPANVSIPRNTKSANLAWGQNFVNVIEADPGAYMVDLVTVADLRTLIDNYTDQFAVAGVVNNLANSPGEYTQPNRAALSTAAQEFIALASQIAVQIQANNAVSDADKLLAGVVPRNFSRTPVPAPNSEPILAVPLASNGVHQVDFADINTPTSRRKPFGVVHCQLFGQIHEIGSPGMFASARLIGSFTKSPMIVTHDQADAGKVASYWGRWVTRTGLTGPLGGSTSATIMFAD